jgi:hypothetical protein
MSVDTLPMGYNGEVVTFPPECIRSSIEHMDGSEVHLTMEWLGEEVHRVWVTSRFLMPSGRVYRISELRWEQEAEGVWIVHVFGQAVRTPA